MIKNRGWLIFAAGFLIFMLFPINSRAAVVCPAGVCARQDPAGSFCSPGDSKTCIGASSYGTATACVIGTSTCRLSVRGSISPSTWSDCSGWKTTNYQNIETKCDNIDNDCDGLVDENGICNEACFNKLDDNADTLIDCQDSKCLKGYINNSRFCIPLGDVDADDSGRVDGFDLAILGRAFDTTPSDSNWDSRADINKDLIVNNVDLAWLNASFGVAYNTAQFLCAKKPSNIATNFIAVNDITDKAAASSRLNLGNYKLEFKAIPGHNYTTFDDTEDGNCCTRRTTGECLTYAKNERFVLFDVIPGNPTVYNQIAYQEKIGICNQDPIQNGYVQSNWTWRTITDGKTDCNYQTCVNQGNTWQDNKSECSYLVAQYTRGAAYVEVPAGEANTWDIDDRLFANDKAVNIECIELAGSNTCGGATTSYDKVYKRLLGRLGPHPIGTLVGINVDCTYGSQDSCQEIATSSTTTTSIGDGSSSSSSSSSSSTTTSIDVGGDTSTTTTIQNSGSVCGNGVKEFGEQCELANDCVALEMNECDISGIVTGFTCSCYSGLTNNEIEIVIFTTPCQTSSQGDTEGIRTEITRTINKTSNALIDETSRQLACTLPPVNIPVFGFLNIFIVAGLLIGYYMIRNRKED